MDVQLVVSTVVSGILFARFSTVEFGVLNRMYDIGIYTIKCTSENHR